MDLLLNFSPTHRPLSGDDARHTKEIQATVGVSANGVSDIVFYKV